MLPWIKLPIHGGQGGQPWDDGTYGRVRKVYVGLGLHNFIGYIEFVYEKEGNQETRVHGTRPHQVEEFVLGDDEYIISVEGSIGKYNDYYKIFSVSSVTFKTSTGRTSQKFGVENSNKFVIENNGFELVGFYGRAGDALDAIGAYALKPLTKILPKGGTGGGLWDDGAFHAVRKVYVGNGDSCVGYIKFVYEKWGKEETRVHGRNLIEPIEFVLDHDEYITSVEGTMAYHPTYVTRVVTSLIFKTSKARASPTFGFENGDKFVLEDQSNPIVGFYGRSGEAIDALGAYVIMSPTLSDG